MKRIHSASILILFVLIIGSTAACGNTGADTGSTDTGNRYVVEQTIPSVDSNATEESLIGNWKNIDDPSQFAVITKENSEFQYEDNDGKYPAAYADGKLKVKISDQESDIAEVYIDSRTGNLMMVYQDSLFQFKKG